MTASEFIIEGEKRYWLHPAAAGHSAATLTPEVWMSSARNSKK
jgi:Na+-transporting NADH:ubiquinone oxidoreductase subunit NqrB